MEILIPDSTMSPPVSLSEQVFSAYLNLPSISLEINDQNSIAIVTSTLGEPHVKILDKDYSVFQLGREVYSLLEGKENTSTSPSIASVTVLELFKTDWTLDLHLEVKEDVFERLTVMQNIFRGHVLNLVGCLTF
jgi:hypothetical protein